MDPKKIFLLLALASTAAVATGQDQIHGTVKVREADRSLHPLPDARVGWAGGAAVMSDSTGHFMLPFPESWPAVLVSSSFATSPDSLRLEGPPKGHLNVVVEGSVQLAAAEISERQASTRLSLQTLQAIESIGARELKRAACCDVSESFQSNATVDVSYGDAVSGTKTIRMLGLDGKYAQINTENIPFVRGLSANSGLTLLPGPWISEINVSKGIGTAVNGPNAMTGQIELCLLDPATAPALFTNFYGNSHGRAELNVNAAQHLGKGGDNILMVHGSMLQNALDDNGDGFMDQPLGKRFNIMDRWMQRSGNRTTQLILRYVIDQRNGGQMEGAALGESSGGRRYTVDIGNEMADLVFKNGWILKDPAKSIGLLTGFRNHTLSSVFGDNNYQGAQRSAYGNVVYQQLLKNNDQIKAGASFQFDDYEEVFRPVPAERMDLGRTERMPGLFAEYTRNRNRFTLVAGMRADFNSEYGEAYSPRLHLKYDLAPLTTLRFSAGSGFRSANPVVEFPAAQASSRQVIFEGDLGFERSWNTGLSLLHKFKWFGKKWSVAVDAYRTDFTAQVVADYDRSPQQLVFYMLDGPSYANSALADVQVQLSKQWELKVSYRWYQAETAYDGVLRERPLVPTHRGLLDLGYVSKNEKWRFDASLNGFGTARMPSTAANPEEYRMPDRSPAYATLNAQITRVLGAWELYLGGENLTGAMQSRQILSPQDPFGPYFDASLIWGPVNMQMAYFGLRYTLNGKAANTTQHQ
ncbi:MAG TPA: TonB-dependent receptor [Flavobacteriales bacterium]|nr:TonB-dependent receptor [Flavobacteriales bacterium]HRP82853.1 TonB-dependent receptor [Flavobacteriales bacterium]HRQ85840.1 TonB-dependent receptor [Flavobacteriales bacterium]